MGRQVRHRMDGSLFCVQMVKLVLCFYHSAKTFQVAIVATAAAGHRREALAKESRRCSAI